MVFNKFCLLVIQWTVAEYLLQELSSGCPADQGNRWKRCGQANTSPEVQVHPGLKHGMSTHHHSVWLKVFYLVPNLLHFPLAFPLYSSSDNGMCTIFADCLMYSPCCDDTCICRPKLCLHLPFRCAGDLSALMFRTLQGQRWLCLCLWQYRGWMSHPPPTHYCGDKGQTADLIKGLIPLLSCWVTPGNPGNFSKPTCPYL